ncbi:DUF6427 family protein [Aureivirga marina]|uniref:DUF6427 family protein n=1 Tax=Aureivirga marina TaxID=1182451 RepID=UPI001E3172E2|nr:DUF6427 family protein [Aureivirga marina]
MIANFFNKTKPINLLSIIFLLFVISIIPFLKNIAENYSFINILESVGIFMFSLLFLIIFSFVIRKNNLTKNNSYGALFTIIILAMLPKVLHWNPIFLSNFFLILFFRRVFSLSSTKNSKQKLFDAGFWLAVSALFFNWSILFGVLIYISLFIFEKINIKNLLIPIIGFICPLILFYTYTLWTDNSELFMNSFTIYYNMEFEVYQKNYPNILALGLLTISTFVSILFTTPRISNQGNVIKYSWGILVLSFFLALVIIAFSSQKTTETLLFLLFPCATILSNYIQVIKKVWIKESILYIFIGCAIFLQYYFLNH